MSTAGKPITCKAMVARAAKQPLTLETITVDPPKEGEVRVKVVANALCHTDIYTLDGADPEGLFPCILGEYIQFNSYTVFNSCCTTLEYQIHCKAISGIMLVILVSRIAS